MIPVPLPLEMYQLQFPKKEPSPVLLMKENSHHWIRLVCANAPKGALLVYDIVEMEARRPSWGSLPPPLARNLDVTPLLIECMY